MGAFLFDVAASYGAGVRIAYDMSNADPLEPIKWNPLAPLLLYTPPCHTWNPFPSALLVESFSVDIPAAIPPLLSPVMTSLTLPRTIDAAAQCAANDK